MEYNGSRIPVWAIALISIVAVILVFVLLLYIGRNRKKDEDSPEADGLPTPLSGSKNVTSSIETVNPEAVLGPVYEAPSGTVPTAEQNTQTQTRDEANNKPQKYGWYGMPVSLDGIGLDVLTSTAACLRVPLARRCTRSRLCIITTYSNISTRLANGETKPSSQDI